MHPGPPNIKAIVAAGASPRDAIKAALRGTFADFATRHGFAPSHVSNCVNGRQRHERVRAALASELSVDREWLDSLLDGTPGKALGADDDARTEAA